jgi:mono/diheme cytochrome c family protein
MAKISIARPTRGRQRRTAVLSMLAVLALAASISATGSQRGVGNGGASQDAELFKTYCASCHGVSAVGNGPLALSLRHAPPDLTLLAKANGGVFPGPRVRRIIEGRDVESHGDREMPVWGDAFRATAEGRSVERANARIAALVSYLEAIQHRDAE